MNIAYLQRVNELVQRRDRVTMLRDLKTNGVLIVTNQDDREMTLELSEDEIQTLLNQKVNDINTQLINLGVNLTPRPPAPAAS